jgi:hypothetical protein
VFGKCLSFASAGNVEKCILIYFQTKICSKNYLLVKGNKKCEAKLCKKDKHTLNKNKNSKKISDFFYLEKSGFLFI